MCGGATEVIAEEVIVLCVCVLCVHMCTCCQQPGLPAATPVVGVHAGSCVGGAVDLITACDIRMCSEDATFCVKVGAGREGRGRGTGRGGRGEGRGGWGRRERRGTESGTMKNV